MKYENEMEIDVGRCIRALGKKVWFIAALAVVGGIIGIALTLNPGEDKYGASSSVYSVSAGSYKDSQTGTSAMNDYADIATSMKVCERAALLMGNANVTGTNIKSATSVKLSQTNSNSYTQVDSAIMTITSYWADPVVAMEMSQAVAEAFMIEMENILGTDDVQLLDKPYNYFVSYDATQNAWKIRLISIAAGALAAMVIIILSEIFGTKAATIRECTLREQLPVIGVIPDYKE